MEVFARTTPRQAGDGIRSRLQPEVDRAAGAVIERWGEQGRGSVMAIEIVWVMLFLAVICVMLATRPVPRPDSRRTRRPDAERTRTASRRDATDEAESDRDPDHGGGDQTARLGRFRGIGPMTEEQTGIAAIRFISIGRNRWDRIDLLHAIGPDQVVAESTLALWPSNGQLNR